MLLALVGSCERTTDPGRLTPPTGYYTLASTGLDATGRGVVGFNNHGDIAFHDSTKAYRYRDGVLTQLEGVPGAATTRAIAMNEAGVVIGRSGMTALRWTVGSSAPEETPISTRGSLADINDAGDAVFEWGYYAFSEPRDTAFVVVWTAQGTMQTFQSPTATGLTGTFGLLQVHGLNNSGEVLAVVSQLHSWVEVLSPLQRPPSPGSCDWATQVGAVAINDSGAYITYPFSKSQCLVRPGRPTATLAAFNTSRTRFNNNSWMAGVAKSDGKPVLATHPDSVVAADDLFESELDRDGWVIESFAALNDSNQVLAVATKGSLREFVVLTPRKHQ